ncbi:MAG TPA: hypothetical protein VI299_17700 [Polyangiales bacterium]
MSLAQAAPFASSQLGREAVWGALFRPRALFGSLTPGSLVPAAQLAVANFALVAVATVLTDDALWLGDPLRAWGRGLALWFVGSAWLLGPQAYLFKWVMRTFGADQPLSLAQRGMAALSTLLSVFGVVLSVAGTNPESAPFVITWLLALLVAAVLAAHALFRLAEGAYRLPRNKAAASVLTFAFVHGFALTLALGVLFSVVGS